MPRAYYNEIEPAAVHVLRALIDENIIAPGDVDDRPIKEVRPSDLIGYTQCHFFAGGGLWSVAARMAGWPDERPIWTGSCPCQPFSVAGKGLGHADPRHLWPDFHRLITACKPPVVFGEQVAGAAGYAWFDGVAADLEREGYTAEAFDIPAAAVDAPHIRQRLYWIAAANSARLFERKQDYDVRAVTWQNARISSGGGRGGYGESGMADTDSRGHPRRPEASERGAEWGIAAERIGGDVAYSNGAKPRRWQFGFQPWSGIHHGDETKQERASLWHDHEWRTGADGKARRVKPGVRLLVDGLSKAASAVYAIEREANERFVDACSSQGNADKVLQILREAVQQEEDWEKKSIGVLLELHEAEILLDFLFCIDAARNGTSVEGRISKTHHEARRRLLRSMWPHGKFSCSPYRRRRNEQVGDEFADFVLSLPFVLARFIEAHWQAVREAYASADRVSHLRIAGNAIVPQLAAEVIKAFMESE